MESNRKTFRSVDSFSADRERHYRALAQNSGVGLWEFAHDGCTRYLNPAMCHMLQIDGADELDGRPPQSFFSEASVQEFEKQLDRWWSGIAGTCEIEITGKKDGHRQTLMHGAPLLTSDGAVGSILGTFMDITEYKLVNERMQLSSRLESIGILAGGVAHDFNNILQAIIGYCDLLFMQQLSPACSRQVGEILKVSERAVMLTRQLLAFSRRQVMSPEVLNLNTVITELDSMLRPLVRKTITLTTALDPAAGLVKADRGQIEQIIINLAVNARDAMSDGGVLTLQTENVELPEGTMRGVYVRGASYVVMSVRDTGSGIPPEIRDRIFEPFYTTKEGNKGTGLGLSTVYGIVKQSGGYIFVDTEMNQGSTFKVYLPRVFDAAPAPPTESKSKARAVKGKECILVVDDEHEVRSLVSRFLSGHGYTVVEAGNGADALEIFTNRVHEIQMVVTDVVMPQLDGIELGRRVEALSPQTPILYMSGYLNQTVNGATLDTKTNLLQKPFTAEILLTRVRQRLDASKLIK